MRDDHDGCRRRVEVCRTLRPVGLLTLALGYACLPLMATAQESGIGTIEEVVVSASRVARSGFTAPTPTTVIGEEDIQLQGVRNIAHLLHELPAMRPANQSPTNTTNMGAHYANLRSMGVDRTLVLVNRRRVVGSNTNNDVDLNLIPAPIIKRVEVVTGGASAAWGSDAVAGVVNVILDDELEGFKGDVQFGQTQRADNKEHGASFGYGTRFAGGRGHVVVAGEYMDHSGMVDVYNRDWAKPNWALVANPNYVPGGPEPARIVSPNATLSRHTEGGVIITPALRGIQFGPNGAPMQFNLGTHVGTLFMIGGDGDYIGRENNFSAPRERSSIYTMVNHDVSDDLRVFAEASYAHTGSSYVNLVHYDPSPTNLTIRRDNAFLHPTVVAAMEANNLQSFTMGRIHRELGGTLVDGRNQTNRYVLGAQGRFGESWGWDTYYQYGTNHYFLDFFNNRHQAKWFEAVDAVTDPVTGKAVCRSTLTDPGNACVPVDLFGPGAIVPAAIRYVMSADGESWQQVDIKLHAAAFNVQTEPLMMPAGPLSLAAGVEYRKSEMATDSDPISQIGGWRNGNPRPLAGAVNVQEAYVETVVPLAANTAFADLLEFNGAVRLTDYSTSGRVTTWKAGLNYSPTESWRFRVTRSRDIRAPSITELFTAQTSNVASVTDPETLLTTSMLSVQRGNPDLRPEIADTLTAGFIFMPGGAPRIRTSVDYWDIQVEDAISGPGSQGTVDRCYDGQTELCQFVIRDPLTSLITSVISTQVNFAQAKTRGVDFEVSYDVPATRLPGDLVLRALATYTDAQTTSDGQVVNEGAGQVSGGGTPHWRSRLSANYANGPLMLSLRGNYIGGGKVNNNFIEGVDISHNTVGSYFYVDMSIQYALRENMEWFTKIENLFDRDPPIVPGSSIQVNVSNTSFHDVFGRRFAVGMRFAF